MVSLTSRKILPMSESTITNDGRISPPNGTTTMGLMGPPTPSTDTDDDQEGWDEPQPLSMAGGDGGSLSPVHRTIQTIRTTGLPLRSTSTGTAISSLTVESNTESAPLRSLMDVVNDETTPPEARPFAPKADGRDVSECSRESLRVALQKRKMSLTAHEHSFLDQLMVHGNEFEVQLALEKLQDHELFFEHATPRHYLGQPLSDSDDEGMIISHNAERPCLDRSTSQSSFRRLQVLEERRNSVQHLTLWRAHKSGLALSGTASRASIIRRASNASSTSTSGNSSIMPRVPPTDDIFRSTIRKSFLSPAGAARKKVLPPLPGRNPFRRSQSLMVPDIPSASLPPQRVTSSTSRKSVTFTAETDGTPKPKQTTKMLRRSVSDTNVIEKELQSATAEAARVLLNREESTSSIPSLHMAHPIRQDSISSIPSLHHAHPIRQDSITSIPSLHHAHAIRQDSISSIPSLHHGHPLRQESTASIPSLHHGHPLGQESTASIPSLHHGTTLVDDNASASTYGRNGVANAYEPTNDIANAWIQQQFLRQPSLGSVPHDVTFPSEDTDDTYPETVDTQPTAASTEYTSSVLVPQTKPVLMRLASRNAYEGEGIEVTQLVDQPVMNGDDFSQNSRRIPSMIPMDASIRTCTSWDTGISSYQVFSQQQQQPQYDEIFRDSIPRSLSHDDQLVGNLYLGPSAALLDAHPGLMDDDQTSWDTASETDEPRMDSWNILKDEYANGYGGGGTLDFMILGTDADDEAAQPHVLSPPLMESLQAFLPYTKSGQNFYLKYSMIRDGASLHTFLKRARGVHYSVLALETIDGEVFGAFTGQPWRKNWNYFGSGESFLWKMRRSRREKTHDILEQAHMESEIDVYPYTGENRYIQLCTHDRIAVGGGTPAEKKEDVDAMLDSMMIKPHEWGFGLAISGDFMTGTSSPCVTFGSPGLSQMHSDGSSFEIVNIELWTLTPCRNEAEAEKLELGKLFLSRD